MLRPRRVRDRCRRSGRYFAPTPGWHSRCRRRTCLIAKPTAGRRSRSLGLLAIRRWGGSVWGIVRYGPPLRQSGSESSDANDLVVAIEPHDDDAAGLRRVAVDSVGVRPNHLSVGTDQQQLLVLLGDLLDGGHLSGLLALERDQPNALAAAVHWPELG